ncbi:LacI family transcriptional regulator [Alicyclobacillus fastidiosus]|uniref:LacI family transcriptional regulator n=1 Tax=Alicyclobacillus fastidiosus TaxID=392011 RepID=A0ABY6ZGN0_9BACL|nr:LacI family DNA-binding transcriptional regulator [Alicyclobacillus fastidiosus]WAH42053.1 LacI family transcriptional regulator [Alicyclobacillus fastidiosus]GMA63816.1 LacI family transcriptional regulator [Alicyclobacillus fastidiosus]
MATSRDVAKLAGVSPATVSRVLNNSGYVAADVRERVNQAIRDLNYVPNRLAQGLRKQHYGQIACVMPSIRNPFYHEIVMGIEESGLTKGYTFSLFNRVSKKEDYLKVILEGFYDGIIFLSPFEVEKVYDIAEIAKEIPTVVYSDRGHAFGVPHVYVDLRAAMRTNVTQLIEEGHEQILFLGYEFTEESENPRFQGYLDAMTAHRLKVPSGLLQFIPDFTDTLSMGYESTSRVLRAGCPFTAIAASNDLLAIGAMRAVKDSGLVVPEDISVTGVDDIEMARAITPTLTTTRIPKHKIGRILMDLLLAQIEENDLEEKVIEVSTEIIHRESTRGWRSNR